MQADFEQWIPISNLTVSHFPDCGQVAAVYALRDVESRNSATGGILKYGNTRCLCARIFGNYLGGVGGSTTQRIHAELFQNNMLRRVEIAWVATTDKTDAERREKEFRSAFRQKHGSRPPWDRLD